MLRYGILSTASIVSRYVEGIRESQDGVIEAIASRTIEKAQEAAKKLNIKKYYGTYDELLEDESIDIVYIPTVNGLHYRDCKNALMHHKHVIVEKPFCLEDKDAKDLFELARKNQCFLMEAQKSVFLPTTLKVKELIQSQILGDISYIELKAGFPHRFPYDHWMYDLKMGGGALYGSATYTIELLQFLFDNPKMTISGEYIPCITNSDDVCHFEVKMNDSIIAASTISMKMPLQNEAVIYGENGYIVIPNYWKSKVFELHLNNQEIQYFNYPCNSEFVYEVNHINECIKNNLLESPVMKEYNTRQCIQLVNSLYKKWGLK